MEREKLRARVQYRDYHGEAAADDADFYVNGTHDLFGALGVPLENHHAIAFHLWAGENSWGRRRPGIYLDIFAVELGAKPGAPVVKVSLKLSPLKLFWLFKRLSVVLKRRGWEAVKGVRVERTISV